MKEFLKSRAFRVLLSAAALLVGTMVYAACSGGVATFPERALGAVITPLQTAASATSDKVSDWLALFTDAGALRRENEALRQEINVLRQQQVELDALRRENERYRGYLELKAQHPDYRFADARVIAKDPAGHYGNFTINCGERAGVCAGNPVITAEGLVGVVWEVSAASAKVRTVLDPQVAVSVYISRTRDHGITANTAALANEGLLRTERLERRAEVTRGDIVVTYGAGSYPEGVAVGEVTEVYAESDGMSLSATVKPFVDVTRVSEVFVIIGFGEETEE